MDYNEFIKNLKAGLENNGSKEAYIVIMSIQLLLKREICVIKHNTPPGTQEHDLDIHQSVTIISNFALKYNRRTQPTPVIDHHKYVD